jgi:hypothetical protein
MSSSTAISLTSPGSSRIGRTKPNPRRTGRALCPDWGGEDLHGDRAHQLSLGPSGCATGACRTMETPKVSPQTIQEVVALLTGGKKTAIVLGSHALYGDGLELAGRITAKTGVVYWERPPRPASPVERAACRSN